MDESEDFTLQAGGGRTEIKLDSDELGGFLSGGGRMAALFGHFEERPVQVELLKGITRAFNDGVIGVFEAGTGVGKSYAYLIPSIIWALTNGERVVISTGTINLQQQLCSKDLPAAEKIIGRNFKFVLMKGRRNFICRRRFEEAFAQKALFEEDNAALDALAAWLETTESGSRSDLPFVPPESLWARINSESDGCMGSRCPFYAECFVMRMRKAAAGADIIVVNHHLLFADIESRLHGAGYTDAAVLPPYRRLIFDEAHGIENAATSFFSDEFSRFKLMRQVNLLYRKRKNTLAGYLPTLAILASAEDKAAEAYEKAAFIQNAAVNLDAAALAALSDAGTMRLCAPTSGAFEPLLTLCAALSENLGAFTALVREVMDLVEDDDKEVAAYWETKVVLRRLDDMCALLRDFTRWDEKQELVFWIQRKNAPAINLSAGERAAYAVLTRTPLDIAPLMSKGVFEPMRTAVCTSATLKTGKDFSYWMRRTGISFAESDRIMQQEFPSPFPYRRNMLFAVPSDAPLPDDRSFQQYIERALCSLITASGGRTLALFTSYESLKSAFSYAVRTLKGFGGTLLRQGTDDNARLLKQFREEIQSVLFATDSFWQGVDVPGESLSQVVIVKLPFTVPNDPVFTARAEAIERRGGSAFMELSLPEALIKFRQGVGRLMRSETDRGAVILLDKRIYAKRYGAAFLAGLPECRRAFAPLSDLCRKVEEFLEE